MPDPNHSLWPIEHRLLQKSADLLCHSFSKLALRLCNQVNTIDALGGNEVAGI
jgi:hypothetical protein